MSEAANVRSGDHSTTESATTSRRTTLTLAVAAVAGVATGLLAVALIQLLSSPAPAGWGLLVAVAAMLVADSALVHVRFGGESESATFAEAMLAIVLVTLPWSELVPVALAAVVVAHALRGRPVVKTIFNASSFVIGASIAAAIVSLGGMHGLDELTRYDAVLLGLALVAFWLWNGTATACVVTLASGRPFRTVYAAGAPLRVLVGVGNIVAGLGIVVLARWAPAALWVLPPLLALLYAVYRGYLQATRDRDLWRRLEVATKELSQLDEQAVATAALRNAKRLFSCDWVELQLNASSDVPAVTHRLRDEPEELDEDVAVRESCAIARVMGPDGELGSLRVGFDSQVDLARHELAILTTYARTVATTLLNARLHEAVRLEAERAAHDAGHDSLTGLSNRSLLATRTAHALSRAKRSETVVGLLLLDLDHFKEINDTLGHRAGDLLLCHVADRLRGALGDDVTIARLGGDEFAVLLPDLTDVSQATESADRLLRILAEPVTFDGMRLAIEGSIGVACFPDDGSTVEELLQRSDVAMYQAKDDRGAWRRYDADRDGSSLDRMALVAELHAALERDEIVVYFQPQIDLTTDEVVSYEALSRWFHPTRGLLGPAEFVAVAEHSGLVRQFTLYVLDRAVAQCAEWHRNGSNASVAVNLSARNLLDHQLPDDVATVLARYDVPATYLVLEITETTMMGELDVVGDVLSELRTLGVEVSVDDFGTGYSSLAILQRVAVNEVKVDRTFVRTMLESTSDLAIVRATVELAHSLGLRVVAEGVESQDLRDLLSAIGCDRAQGYHLGLPVPAADVTRELAAMSGAGATNGHRRSSRRGNLTVIRPRTATTGSPTAATRH